MSDGPNVFFEKFHKKSLEKNPLPKYINAPTRQTKRPLKLDESNFIVFSLSGLNTSTTLQLNIESIESEDLNYN